MGVLTLQSNRLGYYNDSYDASSKSRGSAEITLKGIWIDMVEGGAKEVSEETMLEAIHMAEKIIKKTKQNFF